jgi:hypothetical protein
MLGAVHANDVDKNPQQQQLGVDEYEQDIRPYLVGGKFVFSTF